MVYSSQSDLISSQNNLQKFTLYVMNRELLISSMFPQIYCFIFHVGSLTET